MISLLYTGAGAGIAVFLAVNQATADRRPDDIRYAHDLALAIGGDYHCGYGLDMQAVRQAIDERLASLPVTARRTFRMMLAGVTTAQQKPDGGSCERHRLLAARLGLLGR